MDTTTEGLIAALKDIEARTYNRSPGSGRYSQQLLDIRTYASEALAFAEAATRRPVEGAYAGANDAACTLYPGEGQAELREAYRRGASDMAPPQPAARVEGWKPIGTWAGEEDEWVLAIATPGGIPVAAAFTLDPHMVNGQPDEWRENPHWYTYNLLYETAHKRGEPDKVFVPKWWMPLPTPPVLGKAMGDRPGASLRGGEKEPPSP